MFIKFLSWILHCLKAVWKRFFPSFFVHSSAMHYHHGITKSAHKELMKDMEDIVSHDPTLRSNNSIRILEIGVGGAFNIELYPKNCHLIALDPNELFLPNLKKILKGQPHVHLERFVVGKAEDMAEIEDGSVDAVVATHVLCNVDDVQQTLEEIKRVLVKGGKFYFVNHMAAPEGTWTKFIKKCIFFPWRFIMAYNLPGDYKVYLENAGFSKCEVQYVHYDMDMKSCQMLHNECIGKAVK